MRQLAIAILACAFFPAARPVAAQGLDLGASFGAGSATWRGSLSSQILVKRGQRLTFGAGLRLTAYGGDPAIFTNQGDISTERPDRLTIDPSVSGANLMLSVQYRLAEALQVGANLDVLGVATGKSQKLGASEVKPAQGSIFLVNNNDRGSLNSEFYVAIPAGRALEIRAGMSHYVLGYQVKERAGATSRYLRFETVPFVGVRWRR